MPGKRGTLEERLNRHMDKSGECWIWKGCTLPTGYGKIRTTTESLYTHRVAWEIAHGPIPDGMQVLHSCDTPACCNPEHLHLGTPADNMRERDRRGRNGTVGEKCPLAKLTEIQVLAIRKRYEDGKPIQEVVAKEYGVTQPVISCIIHRKTWKHI